jgi:hypothetical protein
MLILFKFIYIYFITALLHVDFLLWVVLLLLLPFFSSLCSFNRTAFYLVVPSWTPSVALLRAACFGTSGLLLQDFLL